MCACCYLFYDFGHNAASLHYAQLYNTQLEQANAKYNARLNELNTLNEELRQDAKRYENYNNALNERVDSLRMQLTNANKRPAACVADKSKLTREFPSERDRALGTVLERATILIAERDKIALAYNELKSQCQLK